MAGGEGDAKRRSVAAETAAPSAVVGVEVVEEDDASSSIGCCCTGGSTFGGGNAPRGRKHWSLPLVELEGRAAPTRARREHARCIPIERGLINQENEKKRE